MRDSARSLQLGLFAAAAVAGVMALRCAVMPLYRTFHDGGLQAMPQVAAAPADGPFTTLRFSADVEPGARGQVVMRQIVVRQLTVQLRASAAAKAGPRGVTLSYTVLRLPGKRLAAPVDSAED